VMSKMYVRKANRPVTVDESMDFWEITARYFDGSEGVEFYCDEEEWQQIIGPFVAAERKASIAALEHRARMPPGDASVPVFYNGVRAGLRIAIDIIRARGGE